jgi:ribose-phosphate pyrophosphokinase
MAQAIKLISPTFADIFEPNMEIGFFPDGDSHVVIPQLAEIKDKDVLIFHRLYPKQNTNILVFLFMLDALKNAGAKSISAVCPYLPYSRQDKEKLPGELTLAYNFCRSLKNAGLNKLITFDCHFLNQTGEQDFAGLKIENISLGSELIKQASELFKGEEFEIIGPDDGSRYLVEGHGGKALKKVRKEYVGNKVAYRDVHEISGELEVKNKNVLILDDMVSSGSTMIKALEKMTAAGAKNIACAATHGLFLFDCLDKIKQFTPNIFSTNTIENPQAKFNIKDKLTDL